MIHTVFTKRIIPILLLIAFFSFNVQLNASVKDGEIENYNKTEWKLYKEIDGVKVYFKIEDRHDVKHGIHKEYLLIRIENTNSESVDLTWKDEIWYDGKCVSCESTSDEFNKSIKINSGVSVEGDCSANNFPELRIHSKFLNYDLEELTKYEMAQIQISKI